MHTMDASVQPAALSHRVGLVHSRGHPVQHSAELPARVIVDHSKTTRLQSSLELQAHKLALLHMEHLLAQDVPSVGRDLAVSALELLVVGSGLLISKEGKLFKKIRLQLKQQAVRVRI